MAPAYHPDWLVNFWLTTPGLNMVNPHYLLIVLTIAIVWYLRKRRMPAEDIMGEEEQLFKHLLHRKKVIEAELAGLEARLMAAEITEESYMKLNFDYQSHLAEVNKELEQYT